MTTEEDDLFEILGIDETATEEEIRKAYIEKSKECHPDIGGTKEEFAKLNNAYQILSVKKTRLEYIKNGCIKNKAKDNHSNKAKREIMSLLFSILTTNDDSVFSSNVPEIVMKIVTEQNIENHKKILKIKKDISRLRTYRERFKAKNDMPDFITSAISLEIDMKKEDINQIIDNMKVLREMRKLLQNFEYQPKSGFDFS